MKSWEWLKLTGVLNPLRHKLKRMLFYIQLSFVGCAQSVAKYPLTAVCVYVSQVHSLGFIGEWSSVCQVHPCEYSGNTARSTAERNSKVSLWWCDDVMSARLQTLTVGIHTKQETIEGQCEDSLGVPTSARMCTETGQACVCSRTCLLKVGLHAFTHTNRKCKEPGFCFSFRNQLQTNTHKHTATLTNVDFLPYYSWHALTKISLSPSLIHTHIYMRAYLHISWHKYTNIM